MRQPEKPQPEQPEQTKWQVRAPVQVAVLWMVFCLPLALALSTSVHAVFVVVVGALLIAAVLTLGARVLPPLSHRDE